MPQHPNKRPQLVRPELFLCGSLSTICNVANWVQCGWIEVHVGAGFKPALAQQTRTTARRINERTRIGVHIEAGFKPALAQQTRTIRWQRGYYEHVIRNEKALDRIRAYIANNPARWADDPENISRAVPAETGRV